MNILETTLVRPGGADEPRRFSIERVFNLGSATRDAAEATHHQKEVADVGVRIAFDVPAPRIYPMSPTVLTTEDVVHVQSDRTSGEVEIVLVVDGDDIFVGVGSDHTDRALETVSILWSKQACPNVLAPVMWRWSDVEEGWDDFDLVCDVDGAPYQDVKTGIFLSPPEVLQVLRARTRELPSCYAVFCGTYVSIDGTVRFGSSWGFGLSDPASDRRIEHRYDVVNLLEEIRPEFRVPVRGDQED